MSSESGMAPQQHEFFIAESHPPSSKRTFPNQAGRDPRIKTACTECKRRKVKCDGTHPCYSCRWYKQADRCIYPFSRPPLVVSRKNFEYLRKRLERTTDILAKLFPSITIDTLADFSHEQLLEQLDRTGLPGGSKQVDLAGISTDAHEFRYGSLGGCESTSFSSDLPSAPLSSEDQYAALDTIVGFAAQQVQDDDGVSSEAGDDVNAISATSNQTSSYVGPSSTMQLFRTILRIAPESLEHGGCSHTPSETHRSVSQTSPGRGVHHTPLQMSERMSTLIDAYFDWVHPATPILDEKEFRATALSGLRNDAPWLCLLNIVLALGAIGCTTTDSREHLTYYNAAKSFLDFELLASKSFETLQSLILMAGWYCHYRNRPNLASVLLGAAFRMAYALGLHKEMHLSIHGTENQELRRTMWWNLVVLDAAEAVTLGRTLDTNIFDSEVRYPQDANGNVGDPTNDFTTVSLLTIAIEFARTMTEVQGRLLNPSTLPFAELLSLDAHLVDWYEGLPTHFHRLAGNSIQPGAGVHSSTSFNRLTQPCMTLRWRYLNLRIMLYRPVLMESVLHKTPYSSLTSDQRLCVRKCLTLSGETIDLARGLPASSPNQFIAWPSTWYVLQVCMLPLLCLYTFREGEEIRLGTQISHGPPSSTPWAVRTSSRVLEETRQVLEQCHRQINATLLLMKEMQPWAVASQRMYDLINLLYNARQQPLRVWNNTEESPILTLASPGAQSFQQGRPLQVDVIQPDGTSHPNAERQYSVGHVDIAVPPVDTLGRQPQNDAILSTHGQHPSEQLPKDWSMFNTLAWPNATWESLFELPDDFQWMNDGPFDVM
ncbi:fungal-specific transcription factor domain-containing protein [Exophiala viscosa]|uniref:Fungal-specific transcription factor domain-containing protein n=1 Tax=Exophiala viscosa TaxID=2486360 RepID=A0AAN6E5E5_9EURO|nr:fungal-specific transcription factor domain-containing protein [Exophiala viscosa]KAI1629307.1 fungal-specific transcription factor domain-containing protein [Exophiala viscosa]